MKQFFKYVLATITGISLMWFIGFLIISGIVAGLSKDTKKSVKDKTVLKLDFSDPVAEKGKENPFAKFSGSSEVTSIEDLRLALRAAAKDDKIAGALIEMRLSRLGMANAADLRHEIESFRKSGKFVKAFIDVQTEGAYYMASVADEIMIAPEGNVELNGLSSLTPFLKGMFAKLEIEPEIFRVGKFKSAVEPFFLDKMSDSNRVQVTSYLNSAYGEMLNHIAASRKIAPTRLRQISDSMLVRSADLAVTHHLADKKGYFDELETSMRTALKLEKDKKINYLTLEDYYSRLDDKVKETAKGKDADKDDEEATGKNKIAIVVAEGEISTGNSDDGIGGDDLSKLLRKVREDKDVKAVVLRINSPGGDALASDLIWREVALLAKEKKIVASMGNVAASGGYYIAMGAQRIYAQPTTITGSIGVFGLFFNSGEFWNNKTGITFDGVKTGRFSDFPNGTRRLTEEESKAMQKYVDDIYVSFTSKAAQGRKMPVDRLVALAGGRVWTGLEAKENGLIDELGTLEDAIKGAAKLANLKEGDYKVERMPKEKNFFEDIMANFSDSEEEKSAKMLTKLVGPQQARMIMLYAQAQRMQGIQARLPFELEVQ